jgi:hypothetical protein
MSDLSRDRLARFLADDLRRAAVEQAPLTDTQIEAYVDGTLDDVDREIVESRLADDPALRAEVDALRELRAALSTRAAPRVVPFVARRPVRRWTLMAAGVAAAAVIALVVWRASVPAPPTIAGGGGSSPPSTPTPAAPATAIVTLADAGGSIGLRADGTLLGLERLSAGRRTQVATALQKGSLPVSPIGALVAGRTGILMSEDPGLAHFVVVSPVATATTDARPTFRWHGLAGARRYRVRIVDDALAPVAESGVLTAVSWRPASALPRGRVLLWQVEAETADGTRTTPAPPLPEARFFVLTAADAARVRDAIAAAGGSDLVAAIVAAEAGLYDEADAALARLAAANPTSDRVRQLAAEVTRLRGAASRPPS